MSSRRAWVLALALAVLLGPARAPADVRVEADEVIFRVHAPGATDVYLIGDFNRWNPTVERMQAADGDAFEVRLFLVAGEYRYKFVVDGTTIVDPDNPGPEEAGSPLRLVERSGGLVLETEVTVAGGVAPAAHAWLRYIGALVVDEGDSEVAQRVDAEVFGHYQRLDARARVAVHDSSWSWKPFGVDAFFDRGRADIHFGRLRVRGFENDSTWQSSGPIPLVGRTGVYAYDAGFRRHGAAVSARGKHAALHAIYADVTTRSRATPASLTSADAADFASGGAADTTLVSYRPGFDDADLIALEVSASLGDLRLGFASREDLHVNSGVVAHIEREIIDFSTTIFATRERRRVASTWAGYQLPLHLNASGAFGWGDIELDANARGDSAGAIPARIDARAAERADDISLPLLDTWRVAGELGYGDRDPAAGPVTSPPRALAARGGPDSVPPAARGRVSASLHYELTHFDFDGVEGDAEADVHRVAARAAASWQKWSFAGSLRYTSADYGDAPDALYIDTPVRSPWLSLWDEVDVASMVGVGLSDYNVLAVSAVRAGSQRDGAAELVVQTRGFAHEIVHSSARAWIEQRVWGRWRGAIDARAAWYDAPSAGRDAFHLAGYLEVGYRFDGIDINVGVGFDPVVFDPVIGDYADIGRQELLRSAVSAGVRRSDAVGIFDRLLAREELLGDADMIKLECVIELQ